MIEEAWAANTETCSAWLRAYQRDYPPCFRDHDTAYHEAAHAVAAISCKILPTRIRLAPPELPRAAGVVFWNSTRDLHALGRILLSGMIVEFDWGQRPAWPFAWEDMRELRRRLEPLPAQARRERLLEIAEDARAFWHNEAAIMALHYLARLLVKERDIHGAALRDASRTVARALFPPSEARLIAGWHGAREAGFPAAERWVARQAQAFPFLAPLLLRRLPSAARPPFDWDGAPPEDPAPGGPRQKKGAAGLAHLPRPNPQEGPSHVRNRRQSPS
jgi:hypothetical protein